MKKRTIILIILFTAGSLIGLIITQSFWIKNAIRQSEKQYDHRVFIALHEVNGRLIELRKKLPKEKINSIFDIFDIPTLDSIIRENFEYQDLDMNYQYILYNKTRHEVVYSYPDSISTVFHEKSYKHCLYRLWKAEHFMFEVHFPAKQKFIILEIASWITFSILFLLVVVFTFAYIVLVIIRQKKLSEMKNDFINNMTHEFKTPLSTVSLASEVLLKLPINIEDNDISRKIKQYSTIIYDENKRLRIQVERMLQMAVLDKSEFDLTFSTIDIHKAIKEVVKNQCLKDLEKPVELKYNFGADNPDIIADKLHFSNIVTNLIDNACKYSNGNLKINVRTMDARGGINLIVEDNGIGISKEAQKYIFDRFYRVHTGNIHNVKGFGLGLHYVKTIVDAHNGTVIVDSEINKGSRFTVYLPRNSNGAERKPKF